MKQRLNQFLQQPALSSHIESLKKIKKQQPLTNPIETKLQQQNHLLTEVEKSVQRHQQQNQSRELLLAAQKLAKTRSQGSHPRHQAGTGENFWQYRPYYETDAAINIDWRRSARSDSLFIRQHEWEAAQNLWIWCDPSPAMSYHSRSRYISKRKRGQTLALAIAMLAQVSGEKVKLFQQISNKTHLLTIASKNILHRAAYQFIQNNTNQENTDTHMSNQDEKDFLAHINQCPKYGHILLISDFLDSPEIWAQRFNIMSQRQLKVTCLCIADPAEEKLPFKGRVRFNGFKNENPLLVRKVQDIRKEYTQNRAQHLSWFMNFVTQIGGNWLYHKTTDSPDLCLLNLTNMLESKNVNRKAVQYLHKEGISHE